MTRFEYSGTVSQELFLAAQRLHLGKRKLIPWLFPVLMTGFAWFDGVRLPWYVFLPAALAFTSLFPVFMSWLMTFSWKRMYLASPYVRESFRGVLTEAGVEYRSDCTTSKTPWSRFVKRQESEAMTLLYLAPNVFIILAREFFESADQWCRARELMQTHLK